jgi:hypothetical protein
MFNQLLDIIKKYIYLKNYLYHTFFLTSFKSFKNNGNNAKAANKHSPQNK